VKGSARTVGDRACIRVGAGFLIRGAGRQPGARFSQELLEIRRALRSIKPEATPTTDCCSPFSLRMLFSIWSRPSLSQPGASGGPEARGRRLHLGEGLLGSTQGVPGNTPRSASPRALSKRSEAMVRRPCRGCRELQTRPLEIREEGSVGQRGFLRQEEDQEPWARAGLLRGRDTAHAVTPARTMASVNGPGSPRF